ncbi:hypothetical protein NMG29_25575 [Streptomyces cocklensis]|uniref:Uncharacterized protein n=1 Tax=Actinacidiphila cocklensis TaxID=887465 RepID=A0A9W4DLD0_9ACTN|nr:hypothetical protein [Actinacidiphila cocklensis]MDD1061549.1 hypothetical protein [Actinacidiphila cocklensis]CAG6392272.1 conserved hypothetical protein [Actinacidiphila cocklensis]
MQSQQPHSPDVPATPPAVPPPPRSRTATVVVSLVAGLVLGAAGVGAGWALSGGDGDSAGGPTPAGDARAACQALDGFDESKYAAKGPEGEIALNRYAAAGAFSASAAAGDASYEPLAQAVRRSQDRHNRVFDFDAKVKQDLDEARRICGTL